MLYSRAYSYLKPLKHSTLSANEATDVAIATSTAYGAGTSSIPGSPLKRWPLPIAISLVLCFVLVLPSAFLSKFFTLDVGGMLAQGAEFPKNLHSILSPFNGSGRYYPLYWLYHVSLYSIFHADVRGYYLVQCAGFLFATGLWAKMFAKMAAPREAAAVCLLLLFSSPNAEVLYTIGKAEPLLYLFCSIVLFLFYFTGTFSVSRYCAICSMFLCGLWSKETAIVLFPFCATGIILAQLLGRRKFQGGDGNPIRFRYLCLTAALGLGGLISRIPYLIFAHDGGSNGTAYMNYSLSWRLFVGNMRFYITQQPDVTGFGILATLFLVVVFRRVIWPASGATDEKALFDFTFAASLLAMAWSYMAILIIFRWGMGYYSFLPGMVFRFAAGYGFFILWKQKVCQPKFFARSAAFASLLLAFSMIYLWYVASSQIIYSQVYTTALRDYLNRSRNGDSLIFESYPFYSEQVGNTKALFGSVFHQKRRVYGIADVVDPAVVTPAMRSLLAVSDLSLAANEQNIPKKDDYVVTLTGDELGTWQIRGVGPFYSDGSVLQSDGGYDMTLLADHRVYWPQLFVNVWTYRPAFRWTYMGYKIYRVESGPRFVWFGRFPDGWIGKQARLVLYPEYVSNAVVHLSTSKYNSPNSVVLFRNDVPVDRAVLSVGKESTFHLSANTSSAAEHDAPTVFRFEVEKIFVPRRYHLGNDDRRKLGAFVRLEPFAPKPRVPDSARLTASAP